MRLVSSLFRASSAVALGAAVLVSQTASAQCQGPFAAGAIPAAGTGGGGVFPGALPPSPGVFTGVVTAPGVGQVLKSVKLNGLSHTWGGDVTMFIESPANLGTLHTLFSGGALDPNIDWINNSYEIVDPLETCRAALPMTGGPGAPSGIYAQNFNGFAGPANTANTALQSIPVGGGTWSLYAYDFVAADAGSLTSWEVCFGAPGSGCAPPLPPCTAGTCVTGGVGSAIPGSGAADGVWPNTLPSGPMVSTVSITTPAGAPALASVKLLGLNHTWRGDVMVVLTAPNGTQHLIYQQINGANCGGCADDLSGDYTFVDDASCSPANGGIPDCGVPIVPSGEYAQTFGTWPTGAAGIHNTAISAIPIAAGANNWTLTIYDWCTGFDNGSLANWELCFEQPSVRCTTTYTTGADFDRGFRANLLNALPDGNSHLRLAPQPEPIPLVWVACSARNTVVRIDANTGEVLGEYFTRPAGMAGNPSRTTVDKYGNVWVGNRDEASAVGGAPKGSVVCIGVVLGGTRGDVVGGVFTPNPTGQYLKGPFIYSTATDRDGDGFVRTSRGLCNTLPWTNAAGANTAGGVSTAEDECIRFFTRVAGTNVRTMAVDANNDVWTGGLGNQAHQKVNGSNGLAMGGSANLFSVSAGGYGGLIDCTGKLWSARGNGSGSTPFELLRYDVGAQTFGTLSHNSSQGYGLGIDPNTGRIWYTHNAGAANVGSVQEIDPGPATPVVLNTYPHGWPRAQGCAVDASGNVWVAHGIQAPAATSIGRTTTSGVHVGNVALTTNGLTFGSGPTGVAIDTHQKVWATCLNTNDVFRIDPNDTSSKSWSTAAGTVDLRVDLNAGGCGDAGPYNYSDMTGYVLLGATSPSGFWTVVKDSFQADTSWGTLSYVGSLMAGTGMKIEVRAANLESLLTTLPWTDKSNGGPFSACGRYLEIRVSMWRDPCSDPNATPILDSLTVSCLPGPCPVIYCTPGTSTNGCSAYLGNSAGQPSVAAQLPGNDFDIWCTGLEGHRAGVIFYGIGGALAQSWGVGSTSFLCVKSPTQRTLPQNSGGTIGACDGMFHLEWYDYQLAHPLALGSPWSAGDKVYLQAWYRDPAAAKTTNLSNGLELTYQP